MRRDQMPPAGHSSGSSRRLIFWLVGVAGLGVAILAGSAASVLFEADTFGTPAQILAFAGTAIAAAGLVLTGQMAGEHFRALERLRGFVLGLRASGAIPSGPVFEAGDTEVAALQAAILDLAGETRHEAEGADQRLAAVIASLSEAVIVITEQGQVSLVNGPAKDLLDAERVAVGTSIFAALTREPVLDAALRARGAGTRVKASFVTVEGRRLDGMVSDFGAYRGAVIVIAADESRGGAGIDYDLGLHDAPPVPPPIDDATRLDDLPIAVIDLDTTGLDHASDRIVSIGAVRMHGRRIYPAHAIDDLVNPGRPIPKRSSAVHGIFDETVASAPSFHDRGTKLAALVSGCVAVGHSVAFDLAVLRAEAARTGLPWPEPRWLCTALLAAALDSEETEFDLEAVAARLGVAVEGRHTALGDSLVTADVFRRLLPRLADRGIETLGQAEAFARMARRLLGQQRAAGWHG
jgi:DNA polymerase-3 subunit epsilon